MKDPALEQVLPHLQKLLQDIRFGSLLIIVHDGRIVQMEKTEKYRFDSPKAHCETTKRDG